MHASHISNILYLLFFLHSAPKKNKMIGIGHIAREMKPKRPNPHFGVRAVRSRRINSGKNPAARIRPTACVVMVPRVPAGWKRSKVYGIIEKVTIADPQTKKAVPAIGTMGLKFGFTVFAESPLASLRSMTVSAMSTYQPRKARL